MILRLLPIIRNKPIRILSTFPNTPITKFNTNPQKHFQPTPNHFLNTFPSKSESSNWVCRRLRSSRRRLDSKAKRETRIFLGSGRPYRVSSRLVSSFSSGGIFLRLPKDDNLQSRISSLGIPQPLSFLGLSRLARPIVLLYAWADPISITVEPDTFSLFSPDFAPAFDRLTSPSWKRE